MATHSEAILNRRFRRALRANRPDRITSILAHAAQTHSRRHLAAQLETIHAL